ncbi:MAG: methylated-DNA--[protein]-cysteine S-methyltransferase [Pseudomonadota bacterium]|nr:methylated-DNA--[protein]-cysteine S-methyltransferase [Pseudomonadota bacterium]
MTDLISVSAIAVASPLGTLQLVSEGDYLVELNWQGAHKEVGNIANLKPTILTTAADELSQFFNGLRKNFSVPIKLKGTDWQLSVWSELQRIKWGTTCSYRNIAERLGKPTGSRAVGGAVGVNPIPVIIPCHRIVSASGALTGFSGGLQNKRILLECEGYRLKGVFTHPDPVLTRL